MTSTRSQQRIAILGGGIIGLTTAIRIKQNLPDCVLFVFSEEYSPYTTGDVSAGYWQPFLSSDDPVEQKRILKWSKEAYDIFLKESRSLNSNIFGVQFMGSYYFSDSETDMEPFWSKNVLNYTRFTTDDLCRFGLDFVKYGFHFTTTTVDVKKYLPYLMTILENSGVKFVKSKIKSFNELISKDTTNYNYIINCTGLGARELCNDMNVYPIRGQILRVEAPWIKECMNFTQNKQKKSYTYILPGGNCVVLGGTADENEYSTNNNENDVKDVLSKCKRLMPSLENAKIVQTIAGLRPGRKGGVRLELELIKNENEFLKVIHNYGHGGSGVTLSWGCASEVVDILLQDLRNLKSNL